MATNKTKQTNVDFLLLFNSVSNYLSIVDEEEPRARDDMERKSNRVEQEKMEIFKLEERIKELNELLKNPNENSVPWVIELAIDGAKTKLSNIISSLHVSEYDLNRSNTRLTGLHNDAAAIRDKVLPLIQEEEFRSISIKGWRQLIAKFVVEMGLVVGDLEEVRGNTGTINDNWFNGSIYSFRDPEKSCTFKINNFKCYLNGQDYSEQWVEFVAKNLPQNARQQYYERFADNPSNNAGGITL